MRLQLALLLNIIVYTSSMRIVTCAVGSKNPVKCKASEEGLLKALKPTAEEAFEVETTGYDVRSGVPNQPMGDEETKRGAVNRAKAAFAAYESDKGMAPDYAVGLEGGIIEEGEDMICSAYMAVCNSPDRIGTARTCSFALPPAIVEKVRGGMELGDADDAVFGGTNSKQKGGTVGHLTRGAIDRSNYYTDAVVLAMVPLLWPDLWK